MPDVPTGDEETITITQWRSSMKSTIRFTYGGVHETSAWPIDVDDRANYSPALSGPTSDSSTASKRPTIRLTSHFTAAKAVRNDLHLMRQERGHRIGLIRVEGDDNFQRLPWELLLSRQGKLADFLRKDAIVVRAPKNPIRRAYKDAPRHELRVLLVVARRDVHDVSARNVSDLTGKGRQVFAEDRAQVDVLRLGTWEAFEARANEKAYDIVHFDVHGEVDRKGNAFLIFESPPDDMLRDDFAGDRVPVEAVKGALLEADVQVAVLNACDSANTMDNLARQLTLPTNKRAGLPAAIGMRHQLSAEAARKFSIELYEALANTKNEPQPLTNAMRSARRALTKLHQHRRPDLPDESLLPSLYISETPELHTKAVGHREERRRKDRRAAYVSSRTESTPQLSERAREERFIRSYAFGDYDTDGRRERTTHRAANAVIASGLHGTGKTALATGIATQWDKLNYVDQAVLVDVKKLTRDIGVKDGETAGALRGRLTRMWTKAVGGTADLEWTDLLTSRGETLFFLDAIDMIQDSVIGTSLVRVLHEICEANNFVLATTRREPPGWWENAKNELPFNRWYLTGLRFDDASRCFCRAAGERERRLRSDEEDFLLTYTDMLPGLIASFGKNATGNGAAKLTALLAKPWTGSSDNPLELDWPLSACGTPAEVIAEFALFLRQPHLVEQRLLVGHFKRVFGKKKGQRLIEKLFVEGLLSETSVRRPEDGSLVRCVYVHPILALWGWEASAGVKITENRKQAREEFASSLREVRTTYAWPTQVAALIAT
ncbi:MAG: CHAT domain-containing protein [Actinomycetota bacterium]